MAGTETGLPIIGSAWCMFALDQDQGALELHSDLSEVGADLFCALKQSE
jgi:hypothetical protein